MALSTCPQPAAPGLAISPLRQTAIGVGGADAPSVHYHLARLLLALQNQRHDGPEKSCELKRFYLTAYVAECGYAARKLFRKDFPTSALISNGNRPAKEPPCRKVADRMAWHEYVADAAMPAIVVIQDMNDAPGCVTKGSFRDLSASNEQFQIIGGRVGPSHAHIHVIDFGKPVNMFGMKTAHDDVIHADEHGAVVIPAHCVKLLQEKIGLVARRGKVMPDLCACRDFSVETLRKALAASRDIH